MIIAYSIENQSVAKELEKALQSSGASFDHIHCGNLIENQGLKELVMQKDDPVLLLVSDNFLKSIGCAQDALEMLQTLINENRVQTIIVDGQYPGNTVPTQFERVSNVIQYMNHWQDQYLEMRKLKRTVDPTQEEVFNQKLKIVRGISSEIGEFLRLLRTTDYWNYNELKASGYKAFYEKVGLPALVEKDKKTAQAEALDVTSHPMEIPSQSSEELNLAEKQEENLQEIKSDLDRASEPVSEVDMVKEVPNPVFEILEKDPSQKVEELFDELEPNLEEEIGDLPQAEIQQEETRIEDNSLLGKLVEYKKSNNGKPSNIESGIADTVEEVDLEALADEIATEDKTNSSPAEEMLSREKKEEDWSIIFKNDDEEEEEPTTAEEEKIVEVMDEQASDDSFPKEAETASPSNTKEIKEEDFLSIEEVLNQSKYLVVGGDVQEGLGLLNRTIEKHPENTALRYQYALLLAKYQGDYQEAGNQLEELLKHDQLNKNAYYLLAELAEINNDHLTSKNYYEKVITLDPDYFGVYHKLGMITISNFEGQEKLALKYFKKAVKQDKHDIAAHQQYARLLHSFKKDTPKALKHYKTVLKLDDENAEAAFEMAKLYKQLGEEKKAAKYYSLAVINNPKLQTFENDELFNFAPSQPVETLGHDYGLLQETEEAPVLEVEEEIPTYPEDNGQVVLITGATAGIGKAIAELFASKGYRLILTGRRSERLNDLHENLTENYRSNIQILPFDVSDFHAVQAAIETLPEEWANVDVLINNAGVGRGYSPIQEGDLKDWEEMIDTNIKGLLYMTKSVAPKMVDRQSGHIINIGSIAGKTVFTNSNVYSATKFAVDGLTQAFRFDLLAHNIRVSQVLPGYVETEFSIARFGDEERANQVYENFKPLSPMDIAETILFMVTRPPHVNVQDVVITCTQQLPSGKVNKSEE